MKHTNYSKNKEKFKAAAKVYRLKNMHVALKRYQKAAISKVKRLKRFYELYTSKIGCYDCKETKFNQVCYEFDHVDNSIGSERKYKGVGIAAACSIKKFFNEVRKTQIVCANCHNIRTHKRRN